MSTELDVQFETGKTPKFLVSNVLANVSLSGDLSTYKLLKKTINGFEGVLSEVLQLEEFEVANISDMFVVWEAMQERSTKLRMFTDI